MQPKGHGVSKGCVCTACFKSSSDSPIPPLSSEVYSQVLTRTTLKFFLPFLQEMLTGEWQAAKGKTMHAAKALLKHTAECFTSWQWFCQGQIYHVSPFLRWVWSVNGKFSRVSKCWLCSVGQVCTDSLFDISVVWKIWASSDLKWRTLPAMNTSVRELGKAWKPLCFLSSISSGLLQFYWQVPGFGSCLSLLGSSDSISNEWFLAWSTSPTFN